MLLRLEQLASMSERLPLANVVAGNSGGVVMTSDIAAGSDRTCHNKSSIDSHGVESCIVSAHIEFITTCKVIIMIHCKSLPSGTICGIFQRRISTCCGVKLDS